MMVKSALFLCFTVILLTSCSTTKINGQPPPSENTQIEIPLNYETRIDRYSAGDTEYAGLYNNFQYKTTLLNSNIRDALAWKQGHYYQWSDTQKAVAREKSNQEMSSQTKVFLAFFTPNSKNDNLADSKTIWRVYLDAGGRRYEGKVTRIRLLLSELQALYPYATRWTTPYELTFDVPTASIEKQESSLTVTGPLGARTVSFKPLE